MKMEILTFYADGGKRPPTVRGDPDGVEQIDLLLRSMRKASPDAQLTILTDRKTVIEVPPDVRIRRFDVDLSRIMFERTRVQNEYLAASPFETPIVLADTDILLCGDLGPLFNDDFDVAFTWREANEMPLNGGVIFLNNRNPDAARRVMDRIFSNYKDKYVGVAEWYGDQFAILDLVDLPFPEIYRSPTVRRAEAAIKLLPCAIYNFSPKEGRPDLGDRNRDALIYHFKGGSRRLMRPFWELHLEREPASAIARRMRIWSYNLRFRLQRRRYKFQLRQDHKRYNRDQQDNASWIQRAELAAEFIGQAAAPAATRQSVADIGCGDAKLAGILLRRGDNVAYQGYDISPRTEGVLRFDVDTDVLPETDIAVLLGVLEYVSDIERPLRMIAASARWLVVSHPVNDHQPLSRSKLRKMNWKTQLSSREFSSSLEASGFKIVDRKMTSNQKSQVWLCKA
jgi:hypothetical protein